MSKYINKLYFLYSNTKGFKWKIKIMIVLAMVQCHYDYACARWFSRISILAKKRLQTVQNKVIRFVLRIPPRTHIGCSEFSRVNILPVKYRADQIKLKPMFNIVLGSAPEYLKHRYPIKITYQEAPTMIPDQEIYLVSCQVSKVLILSGFFYSVSKLWNFISLNMHYITNIHLFNKNFKAYLGEKLLVVDQDDYIYF